MQKRLLALSAAVIMAVSSFGCSSSKSGSSDKETDKPDLFISQKLFEKDFDGVGDAESGPVLKISETEAKPGETAEVTLSVENVKDNWSMCGMHFVYPDKLKCVKDENDEPEFKKGPALEEAIATITQVWETDLPEDLEKNKLCAAYITTIFEGNKGGDGDIATFYFKVPEDAEPGTVYRFDYYYSSNDYTKDVFMNDSEDPEFEKYAFSHTQSGSVTVV